MVHMALRLRWVALANSTRSWMTKPKFGFIATVLTNTNRIKRLNIPSTRASIHFPTLRRPILPNSWNTRCQNPTRTSLLFWVTERNPRMASFQDAYIPPLHVSFTLVQHQGTKLFSVVSCYLISHRSVHEQTTPNPLGEFCNPTQRLWDEYVGNTTSRIRNESFVCKLTGAAKILTECLNFICKSQH